MSSDPKPGRPNPLAYIAYCYGKVLPAEMDEWVREEVFYREALARGLDRDDTIVRRRLRQKLEFLADSLAELVEPTEAELADWLAEHADDYGQAPRLALRQVYVSRDEEGRAHVHVERAQ